MREAACPALRAAVDGERRPGVRTPLWTPMPPIRRREGKAGAAKRLRLRTKSRMSAKTSAPGSTHAAKDPRNQSNQMARAELPGGGKTAVGVRAELPPQANRKPLDEATKAAGGSRRNGQRARRPVGAAGRWPTRVTPGSSNAARSTGGRAGPEGCARSHWAAHPSAPPSAEALWVALHECCAS